MDASGDPSEFVSRTTLARFTQAGVIPTSANAVLCELHRTWKRPEAADLAKLYALVAPNYAAVMESYQKAQDVARQAKKCLIGNVQSTGTRAERDPTFGRIS